MPLTRRNFIATTIATAAGGSAALAGLRQTPPQDKPAETPKGETKPAVGPAPARRGAEQRVVREGNQVHVVIGTDSFSGKDKRRIAMSLLVNAMGGGMSSRLFQRVREELGLAYAVYTYQNGFQSAGVMGTYVGTAPATADQAVATILEEYAAVARDGLPAGAVVQQIATAHGWDIRCIANEPKGAIFRLTHVRTAG